MAHRRTLLTTRNSESEMEYGPDNGSNACYLNAALVVGKFIGISMGEMQYYKNYHTLVNRMLSRDWNSSNWHLLVEDRDALRDALVLDGVAQPIRQFGSFASVMRWMILGSSRHRFAVVDERNCASNLHRESWRLVDPELRHPSPGEVKSCEEIQRWLREFFREPDGRIPARSATCSKLNCTAATYRLIRYELIPPKLLFLDIGCFDGKFEDYLPRGSNAFKVCMHGPSFPGPEIAYEVSAIVRLRYVHFTVLLATTDGELFHFDDGGTNQEPSPQINFRRKTTAELESWAAEGTVYLIMTLKD